MINRLIYISLILILSFKINTTNFFIAKINNQNAFVAYKCLKTNDECWKFFHESTFSFKKILQYCITNKLPVILIIPKNIEGLSPLETLSPWIEGARVALAISSAYFRFDKLGKANIKILKVDENIEDILLNNLILKLHLLNIQDDKNETPEEQIEKRIFQQDDIKLKNIDISKHNILFENLEINDIKKAPILISPKLKTLPNKKKIIVSGAAGFIGSFVVTELLNKGYQVIGLDSLICGSIKNLKNVINNQDFEFHQLDITNDFDILGSIDYCIHLASVPSPEFYYNLPIETLDSGLIGTKNFLELSLRKKARFLFSSTSEVYGDPSISPQPEEYPGNVSPIGKRSQYDQSKRGAETLINLYFNRYNLDVRIARIFNTYGPNMSINDGRVITNFCRSILEDKPLKIYGDGQQTRSFAFVTDTVDGILKLLFNENISNSLNILDRVFNIGNDKEFTINQLAEKASLISKQLLNKYVHVHFEKQIDPTDPKQRKPYLEKVKKILNYSPSIEIDEGFEKTLLYFYNESWEK